MTTVKGKPGLDTFQLQACIQSLLPSKLIEQAMCQQLGHYIPTTDMSEKLQLAYKAAHSTETVLIKVKNDILMSLDNKQVHLSNSP